MKQKKRFWQSVIDFFGDSSPFMTLVGKVALVIAANVCWFLCALPVVTAGASTASPAGSLAAAAVGKQPHE